MASTFFGLNIGKSGLYAYNIGLNTTSHNITNSGTTGYSRQIVNQQASKPLSTGTSWGMQGTGVNVLDVTQQRSAYLDEKFRYNSTIGGNYASKATFVSELESCLNEVSVKGFNTSFDSFYNAIQNLSTDAGNDSIRQQVNTTAQTMTEFFNTLYTDILNVQKDCNVEVKNQVDRVNSIGQQITVLTKQINTVESTGQYANDLRDQRNVLIDELSTYCSVETEEKAVGESGNVTEYRVKINGQLFVDTDTVHELKVVSRPQKVNQTDVEGLYDIVWAKTGDSFNITGSEAGGSLKAVFEVRDGNNNENLQGTAKGDKDSNIITVTGTNINHVEKLNIDGSGLITVNNIDYKYDSFEVSMDSSGSYIYKFHLKEELSKDIADGKASVGESVDYKGIPYYMSQLSEFVRTYAKEYNQVTTSGIDANGDDGLAYFTAKDKMGNEMECEAVSTEYPAAGTEKVLFNSGTPSYYQFTAENFQVNSKVMADHHKVVTRPKPTTVDGTTTDVGVENKKIVDELLALKKDSGMFKQGTPGNFFQTLVAEIGVEADKVNTLADSQKDIVSSVTNQRLEVSGVDLDEEAMNLIKYQNAYNMSAKIISIMDEIYDRLINYTGA